MPVPLDNQRRNAGGGRSKVRPLSIEIYSYEVNLNDWIIGWKYWLVAVAKVACNV